jgi:hypothetical protein
MDEEETSIIEWRGIRINLTQLKDWVIYHIGALPQEYRIILIQCCERYLKFNDLQAAELCRQTFRNARSALDFMKMFRKALKKGVMGWKPLVMALRATADKRVLKEFFDPQEFAILWHNVRRFTETIAQLESRLQVREEGLTPPKGNQGVGAPRRCPVKPNTPLGPDQANVLLLLGDQGKYVKWPKRTTRFRWRIR